MEKDRFKDRFKVMMVFGTRPEAIKMAPVIKELQKQARIACQVVITAQHREMLDQVLHLFQIKPDYDLDLMQHGQTLADLTAGIIKGLEEILKKEAPDLVLVHGDTTTTFAAALSAFYQQIPVGHVEAGLRTGEKYSPWPEEINRKLTSSLTDLHFAPTENSRTNLLKEGIEGQLIYITGNTVVDALLATVNPKFQFEEHLQTILDLNKEKRLILMTTHRRENLGEPMRQIYKAIETVLNEYPDIYVIFPVHRNPAVREVVSEVLGHHERVHLIEPLEYAPFVNLLEKAYLILTDSGGIQEEAPSLGKPVLCLRDTSERPEAIEAGTVLLVGTDYEHVLKNLSQLLADQELYQKMALTANPYGDGLASARITEIIIKYLNSKQQNNIK